MFVRLLVAGIVTFGLSTAEAAPPAKDAKTQAKSAETQPPSFATPAEALSDIQKTLGFVPQFFKDTPEIALPGAWSEFKAFQMGQDTALAPKTKELIGLAVAAQVPCTYCVYAHTNFAKAGGATEKELDEAVVLAANTRRWSTVLNGIQTDETQFRKDVAKWVEQSNKMASADAAAVDEDVQATEVPSTVDETRKDIEKNFGMMPEFLRRYPDQAVAGAWREYRDVDMNPKTALSAKDKSLISLAVSSQIPCRYCIIADTEFAKSAGATEQEINEAIAVSAFTRHWSTILNGIHTNEATFRKDVDRIVKGAKPAA